jgi:hypothetical protein
MIMINEMTLALACNVSIGMRAATFLISKNEQRVRVRLKNF